MSYLLIVYAENSATYVHKNQDLHAHLMKELGYVYGDRLKDKIHPLLIKS